MCLLSAVRTRRLGRALALALAQAPGSTKETHIASPGTACEGDLLLELAVGVWEARHGVGLAWCFFVVHDSSADRSVCKCKLEGLEPHKGSALLLRGRPCAFAASGSTNELPRASKRRSKKGIARSG
mmetsp:Transcript_61185/g.172933  ORF Transcript_61185/g.172933 Transcript_61185/m.172933 type:complete len:127 (-) Transcript_61185:23-403(-)